MKLDKSKKLNLLDVIKQAFVESSNLKHPYVGTEHLLLAVLSLSGFSEYKEVQKKVVSTGTYPVTPRKGVGTGKKTPILDAFGTNFNTLYGEELRSILVEREEASSLMSVLLQKKKANPLLVGEVGVGKSSIVKLLAQKIANFEVPSYLANTQIIKFELDAFLGSVIGREGIEAGLSALHDEVVTANNVILFIPDIHSVFTPQGGVFPSFALGLFKANILYSQIQVIASTTPNANQKYLLEDDDALNYFTVVKVKEPDKKTTLKIMRETALDLEKFHSVKIFPKIIEEAYDLSEKNLKTRKFPQKGIDLLDKAASLILLEKSMLPKRYGTLKRRKFLLSESIAKAISAKNFEEAVSLRNKINTIDLQFLKSFEKVAKVELTNNYLSLALSKEIDVPIGRLNHSEEDIYKGLEQKLSHRVVGQEKAIRAVAASLVRSRLGLRTKKRPIGNFLFLGPTGVGKTETAKVLAEVVFGINGLIKLDMSDFSERHTVSRLVGAPPGYVGYSEGGELTEKISRNPYSVVLFDEIEKAHPDVLNILLQIMDDGVLVDARGRSFDFTHSIVILTSNLGTELINKEELGFSVKSEEKTEDGAQKTENILLQNLRQILRAELLNRLDDIIVFNKLTKRNLKQILNLMLLEVAQNLKEKGFDLKVSKTAKEFILKEGYSDEYGARALKRTIDRLLVDEIAKLLLDGEIHAPAHILVQFTNTLQIING